MRLLRSVWSQLEMSDLEGNNGTGPTANNNLHAKFNKIKTSKDTVSFNNVEVPDMHSDSSGKLRALFATEWEHLLQDYYSKRMIWEQTTQEND